MGSIPDRDQPMAIDDFKGTRPIFLLEQFFVGRIEGWAVVESLVGGLLKRVAGGGALAVQMPSRFESPAHRVTREMAQSERWRARFAGVRDWHAHEASFYYDALALEAARVELWETEYLHVLDGPEGILEWYRGTGLRPYLSALAGARERGEFEAEYLEQIRAAYPRRADGRVLFPFRRIFLVAYKQ